MYINITDSETADNKGGSGGLVHYLDKENRTDINRQPEYWFNHERSNILSEEVRPAIDHNVAKLSKMDAKFFLVNISPSQKEITYLKAQYGEDGAKAQLKVYATSVMDEYARNFKRPGIESSKDLLWFGKVENYRYYSHKDPEVKQGLKKRGERKEGEQIHLQIGKGRLDISLNMERDKFGEYRFQNYEATLLKNGESRTYIFQADSGITAIEAANLLDGRAIKKSFETADASMAQKWVQLDTQQKDKDGNPKLTEFHETYGYNLKNELLANSVLLGTANLAKDKVNQSLEQGNLVSFTLHQQGTFYLQANPAGREVSFYDKEMKPLTMPQLREINRQQQIKPLHQEVSLLKTNEQQDEKQSMGIR
jgi:hypothetical protein